MEHPEKWRETIDPFILPYKNFKPIRILGYPHAGNDVFHAEGVYRGKKVRVYIKAARQTGASIENEVRILGALNGELFPRVIDFGLEGTPFSVTAELPGERLSAILGDNAGFCSMNYLAEYGRNLAALHKASVCAAKPVADRRFFHAPNAGLLNKLNLICLRSIFEHEPQNTVQCFCHGDFHYANVLWKDDHISGILDFELAGFGNRDFDIAWALFRRPGQRFMKTPVEEAEFLCGYSQIGEYDELAVRRYMAQCYVYFLEIATDDAEYREYAYAWLERFLQESKLSSDHS